MNTLQPAQQVSVVIVLLSTLVVGVYTWAISPPDARRRRRATLWPAFGIMAAGCGILSPRLALFGVGLIVPLIGHAVSQLWSVRVLGVRNHRAILRALLARGSRSGYLWSVVVAAGVRASLGVVIVVAAGAGDPVAWLGYGVLASVLPALAGAFRLAYWPPRYLRAGEGWGGAEGFVATEGGVERGDGPAKPQGD